MIIIDTVLIDGLKENSNQTNICSRLLECRPDRTINILAQKQ